VARSQRHQRAPLHIFCAADEKPGGVVSPLPHSFAARPKTLPTEKISCDPPRENFSERLVTINRLASGMRHSADLLTKWHVSTAWIPAKPSLALRRPSEPHANPPLFLSLAANCTSVSDINSSA